MNTRLIHKSPELEIYTIYRYPTDFPHHFVVRKWRVLPQVIPSDATLHNSLEEAREKGIPPDKTCIGRMRHDDAYIVESWI